MSQTPPHVEYHVWHTPDGEIRGVGFLPASSELGAIPLVPEGSGLSVTTITMPEVTDPRFFERGRIRDGAFIHRDEENTE